MKILVLLIGEQIIPNLLPLKHIQPDVALCVFSDFSKKGYQRLEGMMQGKLNLRPCEVDAYNIDAIVPVLAEAIKRLPEPRDLLFNITGGTKPMSIAAYLLAGQLHAPVFYFQTEGKRSRVLRYEFQDGRSVMVGDEFLPPVITLDEYLQAHVRLHPPRKRLQGDDGARFEQAVKDGLADAVDEIKVGVNVDGVVELDLAVRCDNQVGIVEVKTGANKLKMAIDQLNTAAEQRYLGTYTQKFLISDQSWSQFTDLAELAKAHRIEVVELPGWSAGSGLSAAEAVKLQTTIRKGLGRNS